jgi:serine/threonine protein kinase/tetratricopeptide (TPR) repeat protein
VHKDDPGPARGNPDDSNPPTEPPASEETTRAAEVAPEEHGNIGNYRILEQIGSGGMGEVYRAEQKEPIRRTVALKVIKRGMDTKEVIARFEAERQALALMDHPCIAKVFEAGSTPRGRPYFAMEYAQGEPINRYCDKQKLTTHRRLELFIELCEGVQHAHQKAIIHRDLKPSNVLVTIQNDKPIPKIIDFGVAKATAQRLTEKTMYTSLGELIGTPEYMSPEQAEMTGANVDTRTDVYALGVILYELLAGALPFEPSELRKAGFEGIVRMIREHDPARPSTKVSTLGARSTEVARARRTVPDHLRGALRGDLDWITMKALEKDRTRRYGSAADLAGDVRRHLRHEPVLASPPSALYRTRKFVRRHRIGVGAGVAAALVVVAFAITMTVQARRIAVQRDRANAEAQAAREVTEFLVSSFEVADPREARDEEVTARQILERGAEKIERELHDQPLLRAQMMDAIGRVYQNLGRYDRAEDMLRGALELQQVALGDRHADVAKSMSTLGWLLYYQEKWEEGLVLEQRALEIQQDLLGSSHIDTAWSLYYLGSLKARMGDFTNGHEHLDEARIMFEELQGPYSLPVSWCWQNMATNYGRMGDNENRLDCYKRALEIKERILPPDHVDLALSLEGIGNALGAQGDYAESLEYLEQSLKIFEGNLGGDHYETGKCLHNMGWVLGMDGRPEEAKPHLERALRIYQRLTGGSSYSVASVLDELGLVAYHSGRHAEADSIYAEALPMMENALGPEKRDANLAGILDHYAMVLRALHRDAEAVALEKRATVMRAELEQLRAGN